MKKLVLSVLYLIISTVVSSQTIELHYGIAGLKKDFIYANFNMFKTDKLGSTYLSADAFFLGQEVRQNNKVYFELERVFNFGKDCPFGVVLEFQGGLGRLAHEGSYAINNTYMVGPTYNWDNTDFTAGFTIHAQYRYVYQSPMAHNAQLSLCWYVHMLKNKLIFKGYFDLYSGDNPWDKVFFCTEPQLWWKFTPKLGVGTEFRLFYNMGDTRGFTFVPTLALRWDI